MIGRRRSADCANARRRWRRRSLADLTDGGDLGVSRFWNFRNGLTVRWNRGRVEAPVGRGRAAGSARRARAFGFFRSLVGHSGRFDLVLGRLRGGGGRLDFVRRRLYRDGRRRRLVYRSVWMRGPRWPSAPNGPRAPRAPNGL